MTYDFMKTIYIIPFCVPIRIKANHITIIIAKHCYERCDRLFVVLFLGYKILQNIHVHSMYYILANNKTVISHTI